MEDFRPCPSCGRRHGNLTNPCPQYSLDNTVEKLWKVAITAQEWRTRGFDDRERDLWYALEEALNELYPPTPVQPQ